ncbi:uncharacterized protein Tco025E_05832 [Trypanosoma conorhini]|uniref:BAG domain-containing protein n=1 Tax=Trypanosoma conorhini TaxID=83891 RepID=A0A3R7N1K2_9TRYP|nr:uncharacterized protein Tco025E_05832 [Trypanosoma conorhini]RNF14462.1 hypothetical protein Tco025E_05832 [Trypanosoma conorhini]
MDVEVPINCTVGQLREYLIGYYGYMPATSLVYNGHVVGDDRLVQEFPFGSLVLVSPQDGAQWCFPAQQRPQSQHNQRQYRAQRQHQQHQHQQHQQLQRPGSRVRQQQQYHPRQQETQQKQQREREDQLGLDLREPTSEAVDALSGSMHSRGYSNSMHSGGMRTPRNNNDKKQPGRFGEPEKSDPHQSTPPQRSPYRNILDEKKNYSNSMGNHPRSTAPVQSTNENSSPPKSPLLHPQVTASTHASPSHRDSNAEATKASSDAASDAAPIAPRISLKCMAPALNKSIRLELPSDATLGDLLLEVLSQEPRLAGAKVVFRGKVLSGSDARLNSYGIKGGAPPASLISINPDASGLYTLYFASDVYSEPQKAMLLEIEGDIASIEATVKGGDLPMQRRKGYYEELMRILFRTDNLQDLEGEWRSRRKDAVVRVTELQDMLNVESVS